MTLMRIAHTAFGLAGTAFCAKLMLGDQGNDAVLIMPGLFGLD